MRFYALVAVFAVLFASSVVLAQQQRSRPPSDEAIAFAQRTSDLLLATLFAALTQEFDETTTENVEEGEGCRLGWCSVTRTPTSGSSASSARCARTTGRKTSSSGARSGRRWRNGELVEEVQRVDGDWFYRRSIPLSVFRAECVLCHTNFSGLGATDFVGALMLKVPIDRD